MKTICDIYNEMWLTYHYTSPYTYAENRGIRQLINDTIDKFAYNGEYH